MEASNTNRQKTYQIKLQELLRKNWSARLNETGVSFRYEDKSTLITVAIPDQAALRGILNKLWDLNLTILSVSQDEENGDE